MQAFGFNDDQGNAKRTNDLGVNPQISSKLARKHVNYCLMNGPGQHPTSTSRVPRFKCQVVEPYSIMGRFQVDARLETPARTLLNGNCNCTCAGTGTDADTYAFTYAGTGTHASKVSHRGRDGTICSGQCRSRCMTGTLAGTCTRSTRHKLDTVDKTAGQTAEKTTKDSQIENYKINHSSTACSDAVTF